MFTSARLILGGTLFDDSANDAHSLVVCCAWPSQSRSSPTPAQRSAVLSIAQQFLLWLTVPTVAPRVFRTVFARLAERTVVVQ
jgi:hypothetical protein